MSKEDGRKHLLKSKDNISWYAFSHPGHYAKGKDVMESQGACYANFRSLDPSKYEYLGVGYFCPKDDIAGMTFFSWVTGDTSPWRSLIVDPVEIIESKTHIHGFFVGEETLKKADRQVLMNWLIASRGWNEFKDHIRFWYRCVQEDMTPETAYMYCRDFAYYSDNDCRLFAVHNHNHWPWCGTPDWDRILKSNPKKNNVYTNNIFSVEDIVQYGSEKTIEKYNAYLKDFKIPFNKIKDMDKELDRANRKLS